MKTRQFLRGILAIAGLGLGTSSTAQEIFPSRPIKIMLGLRNALAQY